MAEKLARVESLLNCSVCLEIFKDPVTLSCNHSFCSKCLQSFWEKNESKNCPMCRRKSSMEIPPVNFYLKQLAESLADSQQSGSSETVEEVKEEKLLCKHKEETKMFCEDEQKVLCSVCEFSLHQGHKVVPVEVAVRRLKKQLRSDFTALEDKKKKYGEVESKFKQVIQHLEKQALSTEKQIRAEFDKLRLFLREEEESRLAALREEEEQKRKTVIREMEKIQEKMSSLSSSISAVEKLPKKDTMVFLNTYKELQSRARDQCSQSEPQLLPGALMDVAKHLGNLSFTVWQKMKDQVHFSPVILDPNTASPWLHLSDDLTSVRREETCQQVSDNPERHTQYTEVMGYEGFSSGHHSWEVEVGDHPGWTIGVAKVSADRKGERRGLPENGVWCLFHRHGKYTDGRGETVTVKKSVERLRVQLDFDQGKVSFYDAVNKTHIYTHKDTFTEKLLPFFCVGPSGGHKTTDIRMCERDFSVMFDKEGELLQRRISVKQRFRLF